MSPVATAQDPSMLAEPRPCGECGLCCKVLKLEALGKPDGVMCVHFARGKGCTIHPTRPQDCRTYFCIWTMAARLDERWRPDRAGFVIAPGVADEIVLHVDPDRPDAWRREPYHSEIRRLATVTPQGFKMIIVRCRGEVTAVFQSGEIPLGRDQPEMAIEAGYERTVEGLKPFARFAPKRG